jgi:hypothetical protein
MRVFPFRFDLRFWIMFVVSIVMNYFCGSTESKQTEANSRLKAAKVRAETAAGKEH